MIKEELRKEFDTWLCTGHHKSDSDIFAWFWSKLEEKEVKLNQYKDGVKIIAGNYKNRIQELEAKLEESDKELNHLRAKCIVYDMETNSLYEKLKAADEVIEEIRSYPTMDGSVMHPKHGYKKLWQSIEHYKSLKP